MIKKHLDKCLLTGRDVTFSHGEIFSYELTIAENKVSIFICRNCYDSLKNENIPHYVFSGLIADRRFPERSFVRLKNCTIQNGLRYTEDIVLPEFIETAIYPKTPKDKLENFFLQIFKTQKIDGESLEIDVDSEKIWARNFFKNPEECHFYLDGVREQGWIKPEHKGSWKITHLGLNAAIQLQNEGTNSNKCFIAMAFNDEMSEYRNAIKKALNKTGFEPIIIDEEHLASDKTIPDGILTGIKQAKFCVADFTLNRAGVYFESGYALGLNKPVIYICREKDFNDVHFDVKQLQHIIYKDAEELEKKLSDKIEAWIK